MEGRPPEFSDAKQLLKFLRAFTGDTSDSADWPKLTRCPPRTTGVSFDASGPGFEASVSFNKSDERQRHPYRLKLGTQNVETGIVERVEELSDMVLREPEWMHSPARALAVYPYRFVLFTRADDLRQTRRVWLLGLREFSPVVDLAPADTSD
jgi:hypothetical protein